MNSEVNIISCVLLGLTALFVIINLLISSFECRKNHIIILLKLNRLEDLFRYITSRREGWEIHAFRKLEGNFIAAITCIIEADNLTYYWEVKHVQASSDEDGKLVCDLVAYDYCASLEEAYDGAEKKLSEVAKYEATVKQDSTDE